MEVVMTTQEIRKCQMLGRVGEFGAAHRDLFPARSVAGKLFAAVAAAADALRQHETTESAGRGGEQEGAAAKAAARAALRRQVGAIAQTARAVEAPGLGGKFRASVSCTDERLLSQARTFLKEAKPFAETFVAHELPSNFLRQLQAAIDALEQAKRERASGRAQRVGARARFDASMKTALHAVRRLNAIVPNKLDEPALVALWNLARRIDSGRVKSEEVATREETTQPPSPAQPDAAKPAA
jgi:hypothetical protein